MVRIHLLFCCILYMSCQEEPRTENKYIYIKPDYELVRLNQTNDTLCFPLNDDTYNDIKSFNSFLQDGMEFMSFYDQRSGSINIYHLHSKRFIKKIKLKDLLPNHRLFKTTVYVKNMDSIFINNETTLYLMDSLGFVNKTIDFLQKPPQAWAIFENTSPPVFKGDHLYAAVRPYVNASSLRALKNWRVLYEFNLKNNSARLLYSLPEFYESDFYGYYFLDYTYCYNDKGNFVFSFPADSQIYETNLDNHYVSYYGKSKFQTGVILPLRKSDLSNNKEEFRNYLIRDSYGAIYFDSYKKRYLRVAKSKISETDYKARNLKKEQHVIIFNDKLQIIGESDFGKEILLGSLFITIDGCIYARIQPQNEYALCFIRLTYREI